MIEELKQEVKNCGKEMEITKTKADEMRKSLIDDLENQKRARKKVRETVQDLKNKMEVMKKTQTEGKLGMKNLDKLTGTTETSITTRDRGTVILGDYQCQLNWG